ALYGPLPEQLKDPESLASALARLLAARRKAGISEGELLAVPEPRSAAACVLVLKTPEHALAVPVLNFGREPLDEGVEVAQIAEKAKVDLKGSRWADLLTAKEATAEAGRLRVRVPALAGTTFVLARR